MLADESDEPVRWIDVAGRCHAEPGPGRLAYQYGFGGWVFKGYGARPCPCGGCLLDPDPDTGGRLDACPLCGARDDSGGAGDA
jgi:hypothetical protein